MRILMLGWEFPPFFAGGLGTACHGLTKSLTKLGHEVVFILPKPVGENRSTHVRLLGSDDLPHIDSPIHPHAPRQPEPRPENRPEPRPAPPAQATGGGATSSEGRRTTVPNAASLDASGLTADRGATRPTDRTEARPEDLGLAGVHRLPASFYSPYGDRSEGDRALAGASLASPMSASDLAEGRPGLPSWGEDPLSIFNDSIPRTTEELFRAAVRAASGGGGGGVGSMYDGDLFADSHRYAAQVVALGLREHFDVIHAHDWLTYPAGELLSRATGKPWVAHIHATEFDRSGNSVNQQVYDIERRGMHAADRVAAVSKLTKAIVTSRYGVPDERVSVVYNGMESDTAQPAPGARIESKDKIVLFLGRLTMQKGPEYFIQAAKRVLEVEPNAKFVVAGSGDMAARMIDMAAALGIGHRVFFTGFLRGGDVDRVFQMADCFIMPSVSEPFGLVALEAMKHDTPVIISKQSGVSEVVTHALKVDFWDVEEMANKIVAVLKYPPLSQTLRQHGPMELRRLTWDESAQHCVDVYRQTIMQRS